MTRRRSAAKLPPGARGPAPPAAGQRRLGKGRVIWGKAGANTLEVEVVNLWPNRLIADAALPPQKRFTRTNIPNIKPGTPLFPSGWLGPVTITSPTRTSWP